MKRVFTALALVAILLVAWVVPVAACDTGSGGNNGSTTTCWGNSFFYKLGEGTVTAQLIDNKSATDGTVTVWETDENNDNKTDHINVRYDTSAWTLTTVKLAIGRDYTTDNAESLIPQDKKGNYAPDKFKWYDSPSDVTYTFSILESKLNKTKGDWLCIAAYAELTNSDSSKFVKAWGDLVSVSAWKLPSKVSEQIVKAPSADSLAAFGIQLSNITGKYSIGNQVYDGWCVDYFSDILIGGDPDDPAKGLYDNVAVYSSLSNLTFTKNVPKYIKDINWHEVNYLLNHVDPDANWDDIQWAIISIVNDLDLSADFPISQQIADEAIANGKFFVPGPGQVGAIILYAGEDIQPLIITLNVPTGCYKENTCHYSCNPSWSPCQSWEPAKWTWQGTTPCWTNHNYQPCGTNNYKWNYNWTVTQNLNYFGHGCK